MDFRQMGPSEHHQVNEFLQRFPLETVELAGRFEKYGLNNTRLYKKEGDWYGAYDGEDLTGIFHFSNHKSFLCHYTDPEILKKVILLKTIRQYAPKHLCGAQACMDPIYALLSRSVRDVRYASCWQMFAPFLSSGALQMPTSGMAFTDARYYDLNRAMDFLIEAEVAFGRKPRMTSDMKQRIMEREEQEVYLFLLDRETVVSQGMVEYQTARFGQISAVYTARDKRGKGFGGILMTELMARVRAAGAQPALIVEKKNTAALSLYEKLEFVKGPELVAIQIEME